MKIHVLICEKDSTFSKMLINYLHKQKDIEVIGVVFEKTEVLNCCLSTQVDVLLLDIHPILGNYEGIDVSIEIYLMKRQIKTIILSSVGDEEIVFHAMTYGKAVNYITKDFYQDIPDAIRSAYLSQSSLHHSTAKFLVKKLIETNKQTLVEKITRRQVQILKLLEKGFNKKQIAEKLYYTEQSISNEVSKISTLIKSKVPYMEAVQVKKMHIKELVLIAQKLEII